MTVNLTEQELKTLQQLLAMADKLSFGPQYNLQDKLFMLFMHKVWFPQNGYIVQNKEISA